MEVPFGEFHKHFTLKLPTYTEIKTDLGQNQQLPSSNTTITLFRRPITIISCLEFKTFEDVIFD